MKTLEEIQAMSDEERLIKTAELCGWHSVTSHPNLYEGHLFGKLESPFRQRVIPDYLNSLDAMHEAEKLFNNAKRKDDYTEILREVVPCGNGVFWNLCHATARQRNTAFLAVMLPSETPLDS